jgi:predicted ester cyclase
LFSARELAPGKSLIRFSPKEITMKTSLKTIVLSSLIALGAGQAIAQTSPRGNSKEMVPSLLADLARYQAQESRVSKNIATFDTLDFEVFTHQKWDRLHESHAKDIVVHWPDGHQTQGIDTHIADLRAMFVYAPDTRIETHPVKFGQGEWTAVIGVMEGTFTQPMPAGEGKTIAPTGKKFKLTMATVGHWKGDVMDEEYLFWDNATYMKQLGLAK